MTLFGLQTFLLTQQHKTMQCKILNMGKTPEKIKYRKFSKISIFSKQIKP